MKKYTVASVIERLGGAEATKEKFNYGTVQGVYLWKKQGIPTKHVIKIHLETGISLRTLQGLTGLQ